MDYGLILWVTVELFVLNVIIFLRIHLDLKLTGMQGDVMKESMNVAKSLAWDLLTDEEKEIVSNKLNKSMVFIFIYQKERLKDGPSAGTAITIAIYSLYRTKN